MLEYIYKVVTGKKKGIVAEFLKAILFTLSIIYGVVIRILSILSFIRCRKLPLKVISVGNITLGGTGKTPLVEFIALNLKNRAHKLAVLSRGYKKQEGDIGDEPAMLQEKLSGIPVIVGKNRAACANKAAINLAVDTVILDDGFQQWGMVKDLDIVTINALDPFGNFHILPRGILREPVSSLKRAHIFVLTKTNLAFDTQKIKQLLNKINPNAEIFESTYLCAGLYTITNKDNFIPFGSLTGKPVALFSGIGDPASFESLVQAQGLQVGVFFKFPDHHNYTKNDLDKIINACLEKKINTIITTEKDAVRLTDYSAPQGLQILVLKIKLIIKNEEKFISRLLGIYSA